jgi:hypothetical protein
MRFVEVGWGGFILRRFRPPKPRATQMVTEMGAFDFASPLHPFASCKSCTECRTIIQLSHKNMFHIIYMSSASVPFSPTDLQSLLEISRKNNAESGITGLLLYKDGNFLQVIEGDQAVVDKLYAKISLDKRHGHLLAFFKEEIPEREFPNWSMAFRDLTIKTENLPEGFNELLNNNWSDLTQFSNKVRSFMKMFAI